jgi:hypothetical protein
MLPGRSLSSWSCHHHSSSSSSSSSSRCQTSKVSRLRLPGTKALAHAAEVSPVQQQDRQQEQQHAFAALKAATPVCSAELLQQPEGNGLAATTSIEAGQTVMQLPTYNALFVPNCGGCEPYIGDLKCLPTPAAAAAVSDALACFSSCSTLHSSCSAFADCLCAPQCPTVGPEKICINNNNSCGPLFVCRCFRACSSSMAAAAAGALAGAARAAASSTHCFTCG